MAGFRELSMELVAILRSPPSVRRAVNAVEHMWGHVSRHVPPAERRLASADAWLLLQKTQQVSLQVQEPFVCGSTALSELAVYLEDG
jgi:uncharacterized protein YbgA (DUF1722 family)